MQKILEPFNITIQLGDWSDDGHGKTSIFNITSSLSFKEINRAYKKGAKKIGVDLIEEVCTDYNNSGIGMDLLNKFIEAVFDKKLFGLTDDMEVEYLMLDYESYLNLYFATVSIGNNKFQYTLVDNDKSIIQIGGYGLFVD